MKLAPKLSCAISALLLFAACGGSSGTTDSGVQPDAEELDSTAADADAEVDAGTGTDANADASTGDAHAPDAVALKTACDFPTFTSTITIGTAQPVEALTLAWDGQHGAELA